MKPPPEKPTTFDVYAEGYGALIRDPLRDKFAASNLFFFERKLQVIRRFFQRRGIDTRTLAWLDAGCGQGDMLRVAKSWFKSAAGCDPSKGMLQACSGLDVKHQSKEEELPFENRSFDFVTAVCVYHHIPIERRPAFTNEALRVLKPKGIYCVIEHNPLNPVTRLIVSRTPVDADARLLGAGETRSLLTSAGATILETRYFLLLPEKIYRYAGYVEDSLTGIPAGGQYAVFSGGVS